MFLGYWGNPKASEEKFIGDWCLTGDLARKDEEGYFWFVGRKDDLITSAGYRIGPAEIEDCLIKHPAVYHLGIPTLAGTGAEVSRTAVLTGPVRKLGINSDYTPFDQILLDPDLLEGAPADQRFYTAMDSYIHGAEALRGTFINEYSRAYAEKSMDLCREVFLGELNKDAADEKLMIASYFGGLSIAYSQVGVCHALGYGLSYVLGAHHGIGNCVIFNYLEEYYPVEVREFREMVAKHHIPLPRELTKGLDEHRMSEMIRVALSLDLLWQNALGPEWKKIMTPEKARELYLRM